MCSSTIGRVLLEWRTNIAGLLNMMRVWNWGMKWLRWSRKENTTLGRIFASVFKRGLVLKLLQLEDLGTEMPFRLPEYVTSRLNGYMACVSSANGQTSNDRTNWVRRITYPAHIGRLNLTSGRMSRWMHQHCLGGKGCGHSRDWVSIDKLEGCITV